MLLIEQIYETNDLKSDNVKCPVCKHGRLCDKPVGDRNMDAITTLKTIESEGRQATKEEQEILSRYVGWGGLPDAFDASKSGWASEYQELKNALTPAEYEAARASTLNAHFTSPTVIRAIYEAVGNMGFQTGNILEPSMGIGNFFGMLPEQMQNSRLYGVELDSQTLIYLEENNLLDRSVLEERTASVTAQYHTLSAKMKSAEQRMAEIKILQQHIINYAKTHDTYVAYRKAGYSKKFLAAHESEIILHKAAKQFFDEQGLKKLPTVKSLQAEYAQLLSEKKAMYADYQKTREDMRSLQTAKANVDRILGDNSLTAARESEKDGR